MSDGTALGCTETTGAAGLVPCSRTREAKSPNGAIHQHGSWCLFVQFFFSFNIKQTGTFKHLRSFISPLLRMGRIGRGQYMTTKNFKKQRKITTPTKQNRRKSAECPVRRSSPKAPDPLASCVQFVLADFYF